MENKDPRDPARQERLGITDRSGEWGMGIMQRIFVEDIKEK